MEKIASFTVNHLVLEPGIYVSRKDRFHDTVITTFDLRMTTPNKEPVMNTAEIHTIEHLGATFLRNDAEWKDRTVYFGPMGCRTGFYLLLEGDNRPKLDDIRVLPFKPTDVVREVHLDTKVLLRHDVLLEQRESFLASNVTVGLELVEDKHPLKLQRIIPVLRLYDLSLERVEFCLTGSRVLCRVIKGTKVRGGHKIEISPQTDVEGKEVVPIAK